MTPIEILAAAAVVSIAAGRIIVALEAHNYRLAPELAFRTYFVVAIPTVAAYTLALAASASTLSLAGIHVTMVAILHSFLQWRKWFAYPEAAETPIKRHRLTQLALRMPSSVSPFSFEHKLSYDAATLGILLALTGFQTVVVITDLGWQSIGGPVLLLSALGGLTVRMFQRFAGEVATVALSGTWIATAGYLLAQPADPSLSIPIGISAITMGVWSTMRWLALRRVHRV